MAHTLLKALGVQPIAYDDIDLENDCFWPEDLEHPALRPIHPDLDDNARYNLILNASGDFDDPRQRAEIGKHLCLNAVECFSKPVLDAFIASLRERVEVARSGG
jgi:hypothetical protein